MQSGFCCFLKGRESTRSPWVLGWDMGVGVPEQQVGSHAKNPAERTNMELRRSGFEISPGRKKKKSCSQFTRQREKPHIVLNAFQAHSF